MAPKLTTAADVRIGARVRLQSIADHLAVPVSAFYSESGAQDPSLDDLRKAFVAAAEAYTQGLRRADQSVSLAAGG